MPLKVETKTLRRARWAMAMQAVWSFVIRKFRVLLVMMAMVAFGVCGANLEKVPLSGRWRFNCFSAARTEAWGLAEARRIEEVVNREAANRKGRSLFLPDDDARTVQCRRVVRRLAAALPRLEQPRRGDYGSGGDGEGVGAGMDGWDWEVQVIDDKASTPPIVEPGGRVYVLNGFLESLDSETELAALLGREMSHAVAGYTAEALSTVPRIALLAGGALDCSPLASALALSLAASVSARCSARWSA